MSPNIDIPAPLDGDSDSVVTALETAAIFAGRGDAAEALRWLKRAAESSGETGDDMRTLMLARTAADLNTELQSARSGPPPLPPQEPAPAKASETPRSVGLPLEPRPSQPAPAAMISPIVQVSDRPQASQSSVPAGQSTQPSQRWLPKPPARTASIPAAAERPTTHPPPPSSRPMSTPTPPAAKVRPLGTRELFGASTPPSARESALPARDTLTPARDTLTSAIPPSVAGALAHSVAPAVNGMNGERRPLSVGPRPSARVERNEAEPRLRQAARVSVVRSATERDLFLVRVLEDGKPTPSDASEGWLLLVDPNSPLFR